MDRSGREGSSVTKPAAGGVEAEQAVSLAQVVSKTTVWGAAAGGPAIASACPTIPFENSFAETALGAKTVLIVEDNYDNRAIYATLLSTAGYRVLEARNGAEGVGLARGANPDLIVMDLSMPVLDGWGAVAELKADPRTADIPVLALSAHVVLDGDYRRSREAGFVAYLTKPIEPKDVLREIRALIGPPEHIDPTESERRSAEI